MLGLTQLLEGEEGESIASPNKGDILDMKLPESQLRLLRKISEKAKMNGKKVITVICAGMPLDLREVSELSDAVLYAWYPGEGGGDAVADIIFGNVSPSGKLPVTLPKSTNQLPDFENYSMEGRTYKYMEDSPMYPFGFGLGYADLKWDSPSVNNTTVKKNQNLVITLNIANNGPIAADEVIQIYLKIKNKEEKLPLASLVDFKRVSLSDGENLAVAFILPHEVFSYHTSDGEKIHHKGDAQIIVTNAAPGKRSNELGAKSFKINILVK